MGKLAKERSVKSMYLHRVFTPGLFKIAVTKSVKIIRHWKPDTIVVRGTSGQSVGFPVSYVTGVPIGLIRKYQKSHSCHLYEGPFEIGEYVIIDDFIASGNTLRQIKKRVNNACYKKAECIGVILYAQCEMEAVRKDLGGFVKSVFSNKTKLEIV